MPMPPSTSVVMCTFLGERFLPEQLDSLRAQSLPPSEIVVRDDASTDSTMEILTREAEANPKFHVRQNTSRLGFAQNFGTACLDAKGEVIFLCDQDDIWDSSKVEVMAEKFRLHPSIEIACSDAVTFPSGQSVFKANGLLEPEILSWEAGMAFSFLLRRNPVPGMTLVIRREFLRSLLPVPEGWEHDYWILLMAAGLGKMILVERRPLVKYRQHQGQAVGGERSFMDRWKKAEGRSLSRAAAESARLAVLVGRLEEAGAKQEILAMARGKESHLARRGRFPAGRIVRTVEIARELASGGYHRYDAGCSSALKDWLASP